jgi:hypothetical protein
MFVPLLLETPKNVPRPVSDKKFPQKMHSFIAQNQNFPQKKHSFFAQNQKFPPEKNAFFATRKTESYSQMPGKRIST